MSSTIFVSIVTAKINIETSFDHNNASVFSKDEKGPILDRIINFFKKIPFINKTINFFKNLFRLVEGPEDFSDVEEFDERYGIYYQDMKTEPGSEKPTDTSISVSIKNFDLKYIEQEKKIEFDMTFDGTTSGDVYGCYYILVSYFDDGTTAFANVWMTPLKGSKLNMAGYSMELTFIGTGPQGDNDWSGFKARQYFNGVLDLDKKLFNIPDKNMDKTLKDVKLFVRAFSDKDLTKWNQDSISIMSEMKDTVYEEPKEDDDKATPGFELFVLITAFVIILFFLKKRK